MLGRADEKCHNAAISSAHGFSAMDGRNHQELLGLCFDTCLKKSTFDDRHESTEL